MVLQHMKAYIESSALGYTVFKYSDLSLTYLTYDKSMLSSDLQILNPVFQIFRIFIIWPIFSLQENMQGALYM